MGEAPGNFAAGRQTPLREVRQQEGLAWSVKAERLNHEYDLSPDGKKLLSIISAAGERGDWEQVRQRFRRYAGTETPIFNAVMHISLNCTQVQQGACAYERLCNLKVQKTPPTITAALKIYARLGKTENVRKIWAEAKKTMKIDELMTAARIEAAAAEGDVETAAQVLDEMTHSSLEIDTLHVTAAIRACWEARGKRHNAAKWLYQLLPKFGLEPNIVTFTCLLGAYATAPLPEILAVRGEMHKHGVKPNKVFAETYLNSALAVVKEEALGLRTPREFAEYLRPRPPERLKAGRAALTDFRKTGVSYLG